jgi:hypothetical protein
MLFGRRPEATCSHGTSTLVLRNPLYRFCADAQVRKLTLKLALLKTVKSRSSLLSFLA